MNSAQVTQICAILYPKQALLKVIELCTRQNVINIIKMFLWLCLFFKIMRENDDLTSILIMTYVSSISLNMQYIDYYIVLDIPWDICQTTCVILHLNKPIKYDWYHFYEATPNSWMVYETMLVTFLCYMSLVVW
jgi:hypothetical protein